MNFIKRHSKLLVIILVTSFLLGNFVDAAGAVSAIGGAALDVMSTIIYGIVWVIGKMIGMTVGLFISVIAYNNFGNEVLVLTGWEIIRDLCNMGFVVILLVIAIASILQIESYGYRNRLFKILMMAVLINFSKLFTLFMIDISQYVMLEFAAGINTIGAGNFMDILNINAVLNVDVTDELGVTGAGTKEMEMVDFLSIFGTILLALAVTAVALVVIVALTIIIIIRIVVLWMLIIFSPVAYLLVSSPFGQKYSSMWWEKFASYCVKGPVMVFMVWLSLSSLKATISNIAFKEGGSVGLAAIGSPSMMGGFLFAIVMLLASLKAAQELGGVAGSVASKFSNFATNTLPKKSWKFTKATADFANRAQATTTGWDLNLKRTVIPKMKQVMKERREDQLSKIQSRVDTKFGDKAGLSGLAGSVAFGATNINERLKYGLALKTAGTAFKTSRVFGGETPEDFKNKAIDYDNRIKQSKINEKEEILKIMGEVDTEEIKEQISDIDAEIKIELSTQSNLQEALKVAEFNKSDTSEIENKIKLSQGKVANYEIEKENIYEEKKKDQGKRSEAVSVESEKERKTLEKLRNDALNEQRKRTIDTTSIEKLRISKENKKVKELKEDPSMNAQGLIYEFKEAIKAKQKEDASAIYRVLAEKDQTKILLNDLGFEAEPGFNEADEAELRVRGESEGLSKEKIEEEINKQRAKPGLSQFMDSAFGKGKAIDGLGEGLQMSEQEVLRMQENISGILEGQNNFGLARTVKVDPNTNQYMRVSETERSAATEKLLLKKNVSSLLREDNLSALGTFDVKGNFTLDPAGLGFMESKHKAILEELKANRLNGYTASNLSRRQNIDMLKMLAARRKDKYGADDKDAGGILEMATALEEYGKLNGGEEKDVKERIEDLYSITRNIPEEKKGEEKTWQKIVREKDEREERANPTQVQTPTPKPTAKKDIVTIFNTEAKILIDGGQTPELASKTMNKLKEMLKGISNEDREKIEDSFDERSEELLKKTMEIAGQKKGSQKIKTLDKQHSRNISLKKILFEEQALRDGDGRTPEDLENLDIDLDLDNKNSKSSEEPDAVEPEEDDKK